MTAYDNNKLLTYNNTLDDGAGNMSLGGNLGLKNLLSTGTVAANIRTITASTTLTTTDFTVRCNAASGAVMVTLPSAPIQGQIINMAKVDNSSNACTLTAPSGTTVSGVSSLSASAANSFVEEQYDSASSSWTVL